MNRLPFPLLVLCLWIALIGALVWTAAQTAVEPPVWDAMSYFAKGMNFWKSVAAGVAFNPFDIEPTLRPPGTVLMSHPFGFSESYHGFYFRSVFIPVLLLASAVVVALPRLDWTALVLGIALTSMPMLYQFQANDLVPWDVNWGMVDNFMAGVAAISAAAVLRSVRQQSVFWAAIAAITAALCFLIKPSGLLVMGLAGAAWVALLAWQHRAHVSALWLQHDVRAFTVPALMIAMAVFGATAFFAFTSQYFSLENILFGNRVIAILSQEITAEVSPRDLLGLVNVSLGALLTILLIAGLVIVVRARDYGIAGVATVTMLAGIWFWFFATEPWEPRYFVPFGMMALVFVLPHIAAILHAGPRHIRKGISSIILIPGLITAGLLATPAPALDLQRALGINLTTNLFQNETAQAHDLLKRLRDEGLARSSVYVFDISMAQRSFQAVLNYVNLVDRSSPQISINSPIDWQRPSAYRIEEMSRSGFLVFEPITDDGNRNAILSTRTVADFYAQSRVVSAWATTLDENHGVARISDTQLRVLKIVDSKAFEAAFSDFAQRHDWPDSFKQGNQPRWWSATELDAHLAARNIAPLNVAFGTPEATPARIQAVTFEAKGTLLDVDVWVDAALSTDWVLFGHIVDDSGTILRNAQVTMLDHATQTDGRNIRRYTLSYSDWPATATSIAIGFFRPKDKDLEFLTATSGQRDWENRRLVIPRAQP